MSRDRGRVDAQEFAAFTRRIIRAYDRRAEAGELDPADLLDLIQTAKLFEKATTTAVAALRQAGFSWTEIGQALGTTRQAAQQRFASRTP